MWVYEMDISKTLTSETALLNVEAETGLLTCDKAVTHLDWQVLSTKGYHDFDGWEGPAGLVGLNGCSHGILKEETGSIIICSASRLVSEHCIFG